MAEIGPELEFRNGQTRRALLVNETGVIAVEFSPLYWALEDYAEPRDHYLLRYGYGASGAAVLVNHSLRVWQPPEEK